jgi:kumamolisin
VKPLIPLGALLLFFGAVAPALATPSKVVTIDAVHRTDIRDMGRADARMPVSFTVTLRYQHDDELTRLIEAQGDRSSRLYRKFLSNQQFNDYFAPSPRDYARVANSLVRAGFAVTGSDNRTTLSATGPSFAAERYFNTEIRRVMQTGYGTRYANVRPGSIPAEISDVAEAVVGLDSVHGATTDHFLAPAGVGPDKLGPPLRGPAGGYGPFAIAQAYDYPVQHGFDGTGHAVAIAIDYDTNDADLTAFTKYFKIKRTGKMFHVPVDGGSPYNPSGSVESTLDVETVASLDPGADVYVYNFGAAFTYKEISDAYAKAVADNKVDDVSSSFGGCEDNAPPSFGTTVNAITKQGAAKGITFNASTGDFGRGGKCANGTGQDVPATLPYFTSVGGADPNIDNNGNLVSEVEDSGSGGGPSDLAKIPKYQVGLPGVFSTTHRNIPDVSGPYFPDAFYINGSWGQIGGTSWASPATAAFIAEANQVEGARLGFANKPIYAAFKANGYADFHDMTSGNNGIACTTGYDDCSGIGTLQASALAGAL